MIKETSLIFLTTALKKTCEIPYYHAKYYIELNVIKESEKKDKKPQKNRNYHDSQSWSERK